MGIHGIGTGDSVWKETGKAQRNNSGIAFADQMADLIGRNQKDEKNVLKELPEEKSDQAGSRESETKTEIIVKPDGSRVLVTTMSIGGMETTMSLEISKPTKMPYENAKPDTGNIPMAENDTLSDEMQGILNGK